MASFMPLLIKLMAAGSAALDLIVVLAFIAAFTSAGRARMRALSESYGLMAVLVLSVLCIAGTLLMQYAGALPPCVLCWWQRVFMYPIAFISAVAFFKNGRLSDIADYVIALSVPGAAIALYQHLLQMLPAGSLIPCDATGDCAVRSVFEFGFVTIPWMAVTAFAVLFAIALLGRRS